MTDLLCVGEPLFELSHIGGTEWREGLGGDVSNVAIAAARQGARAGVLSRLGADSFGAAIRATWDREGVDHSHVAQDETAPTGLYFIRHGAGGHQFEYRRQGSAASRLAAADVPTAMPRITHLSGITLAISASAAEAALLAARRCRAAGGQVSFDPNLRLNLTTLERARAAQDALLAQGCDIALPGLDDARLLTGLSAPEEIVAWYHAAGAAVVALTLGAEGALVSDGGALRLIAPPQVEAVDASGAGDCFDGCFLAQLLDGAGAIEAAAYAVQAAALSVQGYGAVTPIPHAREVHAAQQISAP